MAADPKKITELTEGTAPADSDLFAAVDISDLTSSNRGTTKKWKFSTLKTWLQTAFDGRYATLAGGNTFTGSQKVPAIAAALEAAQVTAYDATTGQLAIGGIEIGDTGWRDISSLLNTGLAKSTLYPAAHIRRIGEVVYFDFKLDVSAASVSNLMASGATPSGFRVDVHGSSLIQQSYRYASGSGVNFPTTAGIAYLSDTSGWRLASFPPNPGTMQWSGTYTTDAAWPATLPGVAA